MVEISAVCYIYPFPFSPMPKITHAFAGRTCEYWVGGEIDSFPHVTLYYNPGVPFHNFRASKSVDRLISYCSGMSRDGLKSSKNVKGLVVMWLYMVYRKMSKHRRLWLRERVHARYMQCGGNDSNFSLWLKLSYWRPPTTQPFFASSRYAWVNKIRLIRVAIEKLHHRKRRSVVSCLSLRFLLFQSDREPRRLVQSRS